MSVTSWDRDRLYQLFKHAIYGLIFINVCYFMYEDFTASAITFRDGVTINNVSDAFAAFMDSVAWFVLLLIFELETYTMEDDQLMGKRKMLMNVIAAFCYFFIFMAFLGYWEKSSMVFAFVETPVKDLCALVGKDLSIAVSLDDYPALSADNCGSLSGQLYYQSNAMMYADTAALDRLKHLAILDTVNAFTWIVVVVVLQIEVMLQIRGALSSYMYKINSVIKSISYLVLLFACIYWGYLGDGIGFWDAILWIAAFLFIELNIFQWRQEDEENSDTKARAS